MKYNKKTWFGVYILSITLFMILAFASVSTTVKAGEVSDDEKIRVNLSMTVPQDFNSELRIRYYDTIGGLPDHIFILSEDSNYSINIRMLPGQFAYKSTEIDGEPMDDNIYSIEMPVITVVNDALSNKEFKGELIKIKQEDNTTTESNMVDNINETISHEKEEKAETKSVEENKYFGTMTEKEIFEWYQEQMEQIISEDPLLSKITNVKQKTDSLLHFCSYNMKRDIKNTDDLIEKIYAVAGGKDKETDYYKTIAKMYFYVYEEWQKGNQVDFVFEEENEKSSGVNEEYASLVNELAEYGTAEGSDSVSKGATKNEDFEDLSSSDGLIYAEDDNTTENNNSSIEASSVEITDSKTEEDNPNKFITFLKKGGFSFIIVLVVGIIWVIVKRKKGRDI